MQLARFRMSVCRGAARMASSRSGPSVVVRAASSTGPTLDTQQLRQAYAELKDYVSSKNCNPIIVRLAWHDSGTHDSSVKEWPQCGGANGSIRFLPEIGHAANSGLDIAIKLLDPIKKKYPDVSYADLFQMASAAAVEAAGGPKIPMRYGRKDVDDPSKCAVEGFLPVGAHPFPDGSKNAGDHLRRVFGRMGLDDKDIVALSGAHTLGRVHKERSGFGTDSTPYTNKGPGTPGGQSWTKEWLKFDNSYFVEVKEKKDANLVVLETDAVVFEDPGFKPHAERYAADQDAFFKEYAESHVKLSELGVQWAEGGPVTI